MIMVHLHHFRLVFSTLALSALLTGCAYIMPEPPKPEMPDISYIPDSKPSVAIPTPPITAKPVEDSSKKYYTVTTGDTLYSIGRKTGIDYKQLARWNNVPRSFQLYVGQVLELFDKTQKPEFSTENALSLKQEKSIISIDKKNMLKLNFRWPLDGVVISQFSPPANKGIDIAGITGQLVSATEAGIVVHSGSGLLGFGQLLIIQHDRSHLSAYTNNARVLVNEGQYVEQGQPIAEIGAIGNKPPLLHFEIRKNGKPVNPLELLPKN